MATTQTENQLEEGRRLISPRERDMALQDLIDQIDLTTLQMVAALHADIEHLHENKIVNSKICQKITQT